MVQLAKILGYLVRSASVGAMLAARNAGYIPAKPPIKSDETILPAMA